MDLFVQGFADELTKIAITRQIPEEVMKAVRGMVAKPPKGSMSERLAKPKGQIRAAQTAAPKPKGVGQLRQVDPKETARAKEKLLPDEDAPGWITNQEEALQGKIDMMEGALQDVEKLSPLEVAYLGRELPRAQKQLEHLRRLPAKNRMRIDRLKEIERRALSEALKDEGTISGERMVRVPTWFYEQTVPSRVPSHVQGAGYSRASEVPAPSASGIDPFELLMENVIRPMQREQGRAMGMRTSEIEEALKRRK